MPRPRERIYPFFLGMAGCPGECVYCDQRRTADPGEVPSPADVTAALDRNLDNAGPWTVTVAFYGGTFTGLPLATLKAYLDAVWASTRADVIAGVRISTRPDMVADEVLAVLVDGRVRTVELGVQSFDDRVLRAAGRGYSADGAAGACAAVKAAGFVLGVQLMVGLPGEDAGASAATVEATVAVGPAFVRLYPTLVIKATELAEEYAAGKYAPLDLDEAVKRCADACERFLAAEIRVERVGLQEVPGLAAQVAAGPYHPALGDMVRTEVMRRRLEEALSGRKGEVTVRANSRTLPAVLGYGRNNVEYFSRIGGVAITVVKDDDIQDYEVRENFP